MQKLFNLIGLAFFAGIGVKEFIGNGFGDSVVLCAVTALILLAEYLFLKAKYVEGSHAKLASAAEALKEIKAPLGFVGGLTTVLAALLVLCSIVLIGTKFITTIPAIVTTIVTYVNYVVILLIPYSFVVGMFEGKYGKGIDFMLYTVGLLLYFAQNYITAASMNIFVCAQIIMSILMWDAVSTMQLTEAPAPKPAKEKKPKEKKEKKSKVSKKDKKAAKEVADAEAELTNNAEVLEAVKKAAEGEAAAE